MKTRRPILILGLFIIIVASFFFVQSEDKEAISNILQLHPPLFIQPALAANNEIVLRLDSEAGFAAYFQDPTGITLSSVRGAFRTIEAETASYIIGSVPVPGYSENEDAHVYVHVDGWVLAYYFNTDPASKIIDMATYQSNNLNTTKLQNALAVIAAAAGSPLSNIGYYDFRYPNATHVMLIGETMTDGDNSFTVNLPSSYGFYDRGWATINACAPSNSACSARPRVKINGTYLADGCRYCYGNISAPLLLPGATHTVTVEDSRNESRAVIMLIYRIP